MVGVTETELQRLVSLGGLLAGSKVNTVDDVENIQLRPDDVLPAMQLLQLIRALHCFLRPHPPVAYVSHVVHV